MIRRTVTKVTRQLHRARYLPLNHIELSKSAVLANINLISSTHPNQSIIPVLKANAYGHGLIQMAEILNDADCAFIAVDGYFEANQIRDITKHHILVMGYILPENVGLLDTKHCSFVVQDIAGLEAFAKLGKPVNIHLELNTGMNRLGLSTDELNEYLNIIKQHPNLKLEGVMSHLADADNEQDDSFTVHQAKQFDSLVEKVRAAGFDPKFVHLAQTAGSAKATSQNTNAIRLGIGLYGINPLSPKDKAYKHLAELKPVLALKSTVIKVIELKKGDRVSYNGIFTAPKSMRIGVLPLGYYEGVPRALSNVGTVTYGKKPLPIVGRVCMNHTMIDVSDTDISVGSEVTVISPDPSQPNSVNHICSEHGLFNYSLLTGLTNTTRRTVVP